MVLKALSLISLLAFMLQAALRRIPASFTSHPDIARLHGQLLGSGAAVADLMRGRRSGGGGATVTMSDAGGLGRRLPIDLGGMAPVAGHTSAAGQAAAAAHTAYAAAGAYRHSGVSGGPSSGGGSSLLPAVPTPDSRAALKAALDGLETTGITDEMEATEVSPSSLCGNPAARERELLRRQQCGRCSEGRDEFWRSHVRGPWLSGPPQLSSAGSF